MKPLIIIPKLPMNEKEYFDFKVHLMAYEIWSRTISHEFYSDRTQKDYSQIKEDDALDQLNESIELVVSLSKEMFDLNAMYLKEIERLQLMVAANPDTIAKKPRL